MNREKRNVYSLLVRKPEGKRLLGRPRHSWMYNIKINLGELGWVGVDGIDLAQYRDKWRAFLKAVMNHRDPYNFGKLMSGYATSGLLSSAQLRKDN
jgi:hypothetical protein